MASKFAKQTGRCVDASDASVSGIEQRSVSQFPLLGRVRALALAIPSAGVQARIRTLVKESRSAFAKLFAVREPHRGQVLKAFGDLPPIPEAERMQTTPKVRAKPKRIDDWLAQYGRRKVS